MTGQQAQGTYQALDALAEIGAAILLFEIGLHADLYELCKVGKSALWVGSAGVVLPFFGGWAASKYILHLQGLTPLIMGAALTATSVGITARVFQDLKLLHTAESQVVLGAAVAADVIGLVILAVISAFDQSQTTSGTQENLIWMAAKVTFFAVAFLVLAVWIGVKCVPFFEKIIGRMKSRGALTVLSLAFCILVALLGQQVKLALIIGAFVAGLVLSHCECREDIQEDIKPLADIFSAVFCDALHRCQPANHRTKFRCRDDYSGDFGGRCRRESVGLPDGSRPESEQIGGRFGDDSARRSRADLCAFGHSQQLAAARRLQRFGVDGGFTTLMTPPLLRTAAAKMPRTTDKGRAHPERNDLAREDWETFDMSDMMQHRSQQPQPQPATAVAVATTSTREKH